VKTLATSIMIMASVAIANAQSPFSPDTPFYGYNGSGARGGIITKTAVTDSVYGTAICVNPFGLYIGGRLTVRNLYPTVCGALTYTMVSQPVSFRSDNENDHINQHGLAWWVLGGPAVLAAYEACHLPGTLPAYNYQPGTPYVYQDTGATCPALSGSNPGNF
jgi:hypothetical protein